MGPTSLMWGLFVLCSFTSFSQNLQRFEYAQPLMGTTFRLVFYTDSKEKADVLSQDTFQLLDSLNQIMSDYLPESELSKLSRTSGSGQKVTISDELWEIMRLSKKISRKSKGAFDITIGPLSQLWRRAVRRNEFPDSSKIQEATNRVNHKYIRLYPAEQAVKLKKESMRLDLGGIAKGYAVDKSFEYLSQKGISIALVDGGGDIRLGNPPPGEAGWKISVSDLDLTGNELNKVLELRNCAIATSGDTYRFIEWKGKRYSHIIDPRTGYGITQQRKTTVIVPNATMADALASALSVMGPQKGFRLLNRLYKPIDAYASFIHKTDSGFQKFESSILRTRAK